MLNKLSPAPWMATATLACLIAATPSAQAADQYSVDPTHAAIVFRIDHLGMSHTYGRFNAIEGQLTLDAANPAASSVTFTVKTASIDTGLKKRDDHLRSPDFFNANQFPVITFKSTQVQAADHGYTVTGDLALHGVTQSVTVQLKELGQGKDPWGNYRIGFATDLSIKRSGYGMDKMLNMVGDQVDLMISFEGVRQ